MLDYKTFNPQEHRVESYNDAIEILEMFNWQFVKKECAMRPRDEKWAGGLGMVLDFLDKKMHEEQ